MPELGLDFFELCRQFLSNRFAQHRELLTPGLATNVGKAQKVEDLRFALIPIASARYTFTVST